MSISDVQVIQRVSADQQTPPVLHVQDDPLNRLLAIFEVIVLLVGSECERIPDGCELNLTQVYPDGGTDSEDVVVDSAANIVDGASDADKRSSVFGTR